MSPERAATPGRVPRALRPWLAEGEAVAIDIRPSPWAVLLESLGILGLIVLLGALAGVVLAAYGRLGRYTGDLLMYAAVAAGARLAWQGVVVACRRYVLTGRYVLRVAGVFARSAATVPIGRVQHVVVHRTLLERLTATGTLGFATAGTGVIEIAWVTVSHPLRRVEEVRSVLEPGKREQGGGKPRR